MKQGGDTVSDRRKGRVKKKRTGNALKFFSLPVKCVFVCCHLMSTDG